MGIFMDCGRGGERYPIKTEHVPTVFGISALEVLAQRSCFIWRTINSVYLYLALWWQRNKTQILAETEAR